MPFKGKQKDVAKALMTLIDPGTYYLDKYVQLGKEDKESLCAMLQTVSMNVLMQRENEEVVIDTADKSITSWQRLFQEMLVPGVNVSNGGEKLQEVFQATNKPEIIGMVLAGLEQIAADQKKLAEEKSKLAAKKLLRPKIVKAQLESLSAEEAASAKEPLQEKKKEWEQKYADYYKVPEKPQPVEQQPREEEKQPEVKEQPKVEEPKVEETKVEETKPEETKPEETKVEETRVEEKPQEEHEVKAVEQPVQPVGEEPRAQPIFSPDQLAGYDDLFKKNEGSSSQEYQKLVEAYRKAVAYDEALASGDSIERDDPGIGDKVRQALHRAAANYYNAKLSQEQNELRSNRMEMARALFHETAPEWERGVEWRDVEADMEAAAQQPEYKPLSAEQFVPGGKLSEKERENCYKSYVEANIVTIEALGKEALRLARLDGRVMHGKGNALFQLSFEAQKIKEKVDAGEFDGFMLDEFKKHANELPRMADPTRNSQASENKLSEEEKALVARAQQIKIPWRMTDEELYPYNELVERRRAVESYRDKLQKMQETLTNTERRFFNNDSKEYKAMAAEVGNMLEFLNGTVLDNKKALEVIDLDSPAFKFRLKKLQNAAAGYSNAKILQDKNANRQTRFDIAGELMELPDLTQYRKELAPKVADKASFNRYIIVSAVDDAELQTAEGAAAFVNNENIKKLFEADNFEDLLDDFDEINADAVRGAKEVYDLLKKEQRGREVLSDGKEHSAAELALARRDMLLGAGVRSYITEKAASFTEPEESSPIFNYFTSLGQKPEQLEKVKNSLLSNAKDVTKLEKQLRVETPEFRASGRTLVAPQPEIEEKEPEVEKKEPEVEEKEPEVEEKEPEVEEEEEELAEFEKPSNMATEELDDLIFSSANNYNVTGRANEAVKRLQKEVSERNIPSFEKNCFGHMIVTLQKIGGGKMDPDKQLEDSDKVNLTGIAAYAGLHALKEYRSANTLIGREWKKLQNKELIAAACQTDLYKEKIQHATGADLVSMGMDKFSGFKDPKFVNQFKNTVEAMIKAKGTEKAPNVNENTKTNENAKQNAKPAMGNK